MNKFVVFGLVVCTYVIQMTYGSEQLEERTTSTGTKAPPPPPMSDAAGSEERTFSSFSFSGSPFPGGPMPGNGFDRTSRSGRGPPFSSSSNFRSPTDHFRPSADNFRPSPDGGDGDDDLDNKGRSGQLQGPSLSAIANIMRQFLNAILPYLKSLSAALNLGGSI